jgi:hypothetical protein
MATPPGRLGDPSMTLKTEPRINPLVLATLDSFGAADLVLSPAITPDSPWKEVLGYMAQADASTRALYDVSIRSFVLHLCSRD